MLLVQIDEGDRRLLDAVAESMSEAALRSGAWLVCRPGCTQCCIGPFPITALDARRLRQGLEALATADPARAAAVRARAAAYIQAAAPGCPGGLWAEENLPASLDDLPCPALDPAEGTCDLYSARPLTCRAFGPVTRMADENLAACELCYIGASDDEMRACAVEVDPEGVETALLDALAEAGESGMTTVAHALAGPTPP